MVQLELNSVQFMNVCVCVCVCEILCEEERAQESEATGWRSLENEEVKWISWGQVVMDQVRGSFQFVSKQASVCLFAGVHSALSLPTLLLPFSIFV